MKTRENEESIFPAIIYLQNSRFPRPDRDSIETSLHRNISIGSSDYIGELMNHGDSATEQFTKTKLYEVLRVEKQSQHCNNKTLKFL